MTGAEKNKRSVSCLLLHQISWLTFLLAVTTSGPFWHYCTGEFPFLDDQCAQILEQEYKKLVF